MPRQEGPRIPKTINDYTKAQLEKMQSELIDVIGEVGIFGKDTLEDALRKLEKYKEDVLLTSELAIHQEGATRKKSTIEYSEAKDHTDRSMSRSHAAVTAIFMLKLAPDQKISVNDWLDVVQNKIDSGA